VQLLTANKFFKNYILLVYLAQFKMKSGVKVYWHHCTKTISFLYNGANTRISKDYLFTTKSGGMCNFSS